MKKLKIHGKISGIYSLVDDEDFDFVNQFKWNILPKGYAIRTDRTNGKKTIYLHRVIAERAGLDCTSQVDHIDGDKLDNRRSNLRSASNQQNQANVETQSNNTTGFKGVTKREKSGNTRFVARIGVGYRRINLGSFETADEAYKAYQDAATKYFGEFAKS